ncbi:MAG: type IV toxin-antitoxin system AbiEi family antitoxin domain-containing protein [Solirubrobacteraceae bacterium]
MGRTSIRHREAALAEFLRTHHGAISTAELVTLGFKKDAIAKLVRRGTLIRQHRGAYRTGAMPATTSTRLRCALVATGPDAALARASAAHHLGLIEFEPRKVEVITPRRSVGHTREDVVVHETHELPRRDLIRVDGLLTTCPQRLILDLALDTTSGADRKLPRRAIRQGAVRDKRLADRLERVVRERAPFRGSQVLRELLDEHSSGATVTRSELEDQFLELLIRNGLPLPETNAIVEGFEVDGVWWDERVVVELDTYQFHGDVRAFERDRARDAALTVAAYRPIRITKRRIEREEPQIVRQVRILLGL